MVSGIFHLEKSSTSADVEASAEPGFRAWTLRRLVSTLRALKKSWRLCYVVAVPVILLPVAAAIGGKAGWYAYVLLWMAFYWSTEVIPLPATSLMPVFLFPFFGILSSQTVASFYLNDIGMFGLCSLVMAGAVETSNLHQRIALKSLLIVGTSNVRLLLGFMLVTAFLSMWIPNTAATSIMAPIVMAIVDQMYSSDSQSLDLEGHSNQAYVPDSDETTSTGTVQTAEFETGSRRRVLRTTMLLSVAYAANIGGTGSLTGTGPNLVLKGLMDDKFPSSTELTFATWMLYNVPTMVLLVLFAWIYLVLTTKRALSSDKALQEKNREEISRRYQELGSMSFAEMCVTFLMTSMILLWFTMKPRIFRGWAELLPHQKYIRPPTPAMAAMFLLFIIPKNPRQPWGRPLMTWKEASDKAQWGVLILVGGGMCLAEACKQSGFSELLVGHLKSLATLPSGLIVFVLCLAASMFTEVTSNVAVSSILLPVVFDMAVAIGVHPLYLAMPVAIGCSFSFMLPAAGPPNAIVYQLGKMSILEMAKPGIAMNIVCVVVEVAMIHALGFPIFGLGTTPSWIRATASAPPFGTSNDTALSTVNTTILPTMNHTSPL
ncbi:Na(+)/citrate cotransporter-like [Haemaphysalis longicornis]